MGGILLSILINGVVFAEDLPKWRLKVMSPSRVQTYVDNGTPVWCLHLAEEIEACPLMVQNDRLQLTPQSAAVMDWRSALKQSLNGAVVADRFVQQPIQGTNRVYWASGQMDGMDAAGWLFPEDLRAIVGSEVLVAQPMSGAFFVWSKEDMVANEKMAIAIKSLFLSADQPVSPYVYHWKDDEWIVWGEAVKKKTDPVLPK